MERKVRAQGESLAFIGTVAVGLVLLNLLSIKFFSRVDLTKRQVYTLSDGTKRIMRGLHDQLTVTVYFTPNQPPPYRDDEQTLRDQLEEYRTIGGGRVDVRWISVEASNEQRRRDAEGAGCTKRLLQAVDQSEDQATIQEGFRCVAFEYLGRREQIPFVRPGMSGMEYEITSIVKKISTPENQRERAIGFLGGHGELTPEEGLQYLPQLLEQERVDYRPRTVNLNNGENEVPSDIKGLIIMNPSRRIEERELRRLDAYLMRGGSIAIFAGGLTFASTDPTSANGAAAEHHLNDWIEGYGLRLNADVVLDPRANDGVIQMDRQMARVRLVTWPSVTSFSGGQPTASDLLERGGLDPSFAAVFRLPEFVTPYPSTISVVEDRRRQAGGDLTIFARTSPRSVARTSDFDLNIVEILQQGQRLFEGGNQHGPYIVGAAVQGRFRSAFAGRAPTAAAADGGADAADAGTSLTTAETNVPERAERDARLMVVSAGSTFSLDALRVMVQLSGGQKPANLALLFNTFDYLSQDTDLLAVRAKDTSDPLLRADVSKAQKNVFKWGSIAVLPLAVGIIGFSVLTARRSRRKRLISDYTT